MSYSTNKFLLATLKRSNIYPVNAPCRDASEVQAEPPLCLPQASSEPREDRDQLGNG